MWITNYISIILSKKLKLFLYNEFIIILYINLSKKSNSKISTSMSESRLNPNAPEFMPEYQMYRFPVAVPRQQPQYVLCYYLVPYYVLYFFRPYQMFCLPVAIPLA